MVEMAVNYTPKQLFDVIADGTDIDALTDIGRRYPLLSVKLAKLAPVAGDVAEVLSALPEYLSARKLEKTLRGGASDVTEDAEADTETEAEPEVEEEKPAPKKRGRKPKAKVEEPVEDEADEGGKNDGMPAPKLFQECKKRGIKAAPKKPAKYYIDLLEKADSEPEDDSADDDENWEI